MGGPYNIPRNYKGESKILFIFSMKAFLYTIGGAGIGILFYIILNAMKLGKIGLVLILLFGGLGFAIGTFKIPENANIEFSRKVGGESIDIVFLRWLKFKRKNNRIYVYKEEESKDDK
ncbi:MAG: PrgI family protein [Clostridia bacterium]|nr:PrgI family protein [Clostridia bacterium]